MPNQPEPIVNQLMHKKCKIGFVGMLFLSVGTLLVYGNALCLWERSLCLWDYSLSTGMPKQPEPIGKQLLYKKNYWKLVLRDAPSVCGNAICLWERVPSSSLYYKSFMIIIYDRNDSGQYYKTMITIVIYDHS
jgi:hypothetical protein